MSINVKIVGGSGKLIKLDESSDFVNSGGQASIYEQSGIAYKVFTDITTLIPKEKFAELNKISHPRIMKPLDMFTIDGDLSGFTTEFVKDAIPFATITSNTFWSDNNFTPQKAGAVIESTQDIFEGAHSGDTVIGDPNDMNFLVDNKTHSTVFGIDVDSFGTKSFSVSAVSPAVLDYTTGKKEFTRATDWYGFALLIYQLYVGIHPYKARHPDCMTKGLPGMVERCKLGLSGMNSKVKLPGNCRSVDAIPSNYRTWVFDTLENLKRTPPPNSAGNYQAVKVTTKIISSVLKTTLIIDSGTDIYNHIYLDGYRYFRNHVTPNRFVIADGTKVIIEELDNKVKVLNLELDGKLVISDNNIYVLNNGLFTSVNIINMGSKAIAAVGQVFNVMPKSTVSYDGLVISNLAGNPCLVIPFKDKNNFYCPNIFVEELKGHRIVNAKRADRLVVVIAQNTKTSLYNRFIIGINRDRTTYNIRVVEDITSTDINATIKQDGTAAILDGDDIELFRCSDVSRTKVIKDTGLGSTKLSVEDNLLVGTAGSKLYKITS